MNKEKIMTFKNELDYEKMMSEIYEMTKKHSCIKLSYIGNTILSRPIPLLTIGNKNAKGAVLYVATHHATENLCTNVLLEFANEYATAVEQNRRVCQINSTLLYDTRTIYIVPMLNPDGVEYRLHGIDSQNPLFERIEKITSGDFSTWNANARGVDLNHNYDAYFNEYKEIEKAKEITQGATKYSGESPESEPETKALCTFIRYHADKLKGVISLHSQGEEFYYTSRGMCPKKSEFVARFVARMTGYIPACPSDSAEYGGLTDWLIKEMDIPAFTIECGKGKNPLPVSQISSIYVHMHDLLFSFPILL